MDKYNFKTFIDKKKSVTFHLIHRSQKDPLQADESAPKRILLPAAGKKQAEQSKYGIYFEDDYNYMQHLKESGEISTASLDIPDDKPLRSRKNSTNEDVEVFKIERKSKLVLPSSVFPSDVETKVGMLNKAAPNRDPKFDWDPDIVAALDEDFNFEDPDNELEDDFMTMANAVEGNDDDDDGMNSDFEEDIEVDSNFDGDHYPIDDDDFDPFEEDETKSRFTSYSMTSSVIRRNEGLTNLDDRFEKLYEEYDNNEIGALDHEDIDGVVKTDDTGDALLEQLLNQFENPKSKYEELTVELRPEAKEYGSDEENEEEEVEEKAKQRWDCESILSTYSNLYNRPKVIGAPEKVRKIKITTRAEIPADVLPTRGLTKRQIEQMEHNAAKDDHFVNTYRPKGESTEDKKTRKAQIKAEKKLRRIEKKCNKNMFKEEKKRQERDIYNLQHNMQGMKIL